MAISRKILLRMRNVLDKYCRENQSTYYTYIVCLVYDYVFIPNKLDDSGKQ
jgi:hypothetical protein